MEDVDGVGFVTADRIAHEVGIQPDSEFRIRAGIVYCLKQAAANNGHTYLPKEHLFDMVFKLLGLSKEENKILLEGVIELMEISGVIVVLQNKNSSIIMFNRYYLLERKISQKLISLNNSQTELHTDVRALRFNFLKMCNIHLIIVVFPVPGPPVITLTPYLTAFSIALT